VHRVRRSRLAARVVARVPPTITYGHHAGLGAPGAAWERYDPIEITRGCIHACRFGQTPDLYKARFRHRSVANVAEHGTRQAPTVLRRSVDNTDLTLGAGCAMGTGCDNRASARAWRPRAARRATPRCPLNALRCAFSLDRVSTEREVRDRGTPGRMPHLA
jgi:hypothetical protein